MLSKKLTDKSLMLALILLGAVIVILVYFVPTKNITDEIVGLENENASLKSTLASLQVYYDNRETYIQDTAQLQKEILVITNKYPIAYRPEDYIMEAVAMESAANQEDDVDEGVVFERITLNIANSIASVDQETVAGANIESLNSKIDFNQQDVVYTNTVDYTSLKQILAEALVSPYCADIQSITYTTDTTTGLLKGDIVLGYFYVTGTGVEYVAPSIPEYVPGTDNIFGHYEVEEVEDLGMTTVE